MAMEHTLERSMNSTAATDTTSVTILLHTTETITPLAETRSQSEQSLDVHRIVLQGIQGIIILLANICVFIAIRKSKLLRISTRVFMSNLAIADCMQGFSLIVSTVTDILNINYTGYTCVFSFLINIVPAGVSEIGIILMAWECFWTIQNLRITKTGLGKKPAVILAVLSWTFYIVLVLFGLPAIKLKVPGCSLSVFHFEKGYIVVYAVILGLNTTLLCVFFIGALLALRKHRQQVAPSVPTVHVTQPPTETLKPASSQPASLQLSVSPATSQHPPQQSASSTSSGGFQCIKSRWLEIQSTLVTIIGLMVAVYIVVRLPFQIYIFSYYLCGISCGFPPENILRILGQILKLKSLANAVIYTCKSKEFRSGLKRAFSCVTPHSVEADASFVFEVPAAMPVPSQNSNVNDNS